MSIPSPSLPAPTPPPLCIYKILPSSPFPPSSSSPSSSSLPSTLPLSPLDARDSFIHLSTSSQLLGTLSKFFSDASHVYILRVPYRKVEGRIKWERAGRNEDGREGGEAQEWSFRVRTDVFPHLHDLKLGRDEIDKVGKWERGSGSEEGWDGNGWPFDEDRPDLE